MNKSLLGSSATGMGKGIHRPSENVTILFPQHGKAHIILDRSLLAPTLPTTEQRAEG